jgi:hypothetical protein
MKAFWSFFTTLVLDDFGELTWCWTQERNRCLFLLDLASFRFSLRDLGSSCPGEKNTTEQIASSVHGRTCSASRRIKAQWRGKTFTCHYFSSQSASTTCPPRSLLNQSWKNNHERLRGTSFGLVLMHKPAYRKRWWETVVGRKLLETSSSHSFGLIEPWLIWCVEM